MRFIELEQLVFTNLSPLRFKMIKENIRFHSRDGSNETFLIVSGNEHVDEIILGQGKAACRIIEDSRPLRNRQFSHTPQRAGGPIKPRWL